MESYFTDGNVIFLEVSDFEGGKFKHDLKKRKLVVMMGGTFCPHCTAAAPAFNSFAEQVKGKVVVGVIQVDGSPSEQQAAQHLASSHPNIGRGVPAFLLFDANGEFVKAHEGARSVDAWKALIA